MDGKLTRRDFLRFSSAGLAGAALLTAAGCGSGTGSSGAKNGRVTVNLWYWSGSIDDKILAKVDDNFPNVHLVASKIGGDFKSKLLTSLAGRAYVPDITGINSDISTYFPDADQFFDLYKLGAKKVQHLYLDWKWKQGVTPQGRMIGFPMDTGPTALFYRVDKFKQAGLPTQPDQVSKRINTWEDYLSTGKEFQSKLPNTHMADDINMVFTQVMAQSPKQYMDPEGRFIGDQAHVKNAWDLAVKAFQMGLLASTATFTTDWNAAMSSGAVASFVGAVWMMNSLQQAAPKTSGKWMVTRAPGGAGNNGGSFLAIPIESPYPKEAFEVIRWVQSPSHQEQSYNDPGVSLFPSAPGVFGHAAMQKPNKFFSGQRTVQVFGKSAKNVKPIYFGPGYDIINPIYGQELTNVETQHKDPNKAWNDALDEIKRQLTHEGMYKK